MNKILMIQRLSKETDMDIIQYCLILAQDEILNARYPFGDAPKQLPMKYDVLHVQICVALIKQYKANEPLSAPPELLKKVLPHATVFKV